jgi:hypothetical protein
MLPQVRGGDYRGGENIGGGNGEAGLTQRCRNAATAPGSGCHDTVSTPSMSISTPPTPMPRP